MPRKAPSLELSPDIAFGRIPDHEIVAADQHEIRREAGLEVPPWLELNAKERAHLLMKYGSTPKGLPYQPRLRQIPFTSAMAAAAQRTELVGAGKAKEVGAAFLVPLKLSPGGAAKQFQEWFVAEQKRRGIEPDELVGSNPGLRGVRGRLAKILAVRWRARFGSTTAAWNAAVKTGLNVFLGDNFKHPSAWTEADKSVAKRCQNCKKLWDGLGKWV